MWSRFNAVKQLLSNHVMVLLIKAECRAEVEKKLTLCQELTLLERKVNYVLESLN